MQKFTRGNRLGSEFDLHTKTLAALEFDLVFIEGSYYYFRKN